MDMKDYREKKDRGLVTVMKIGDAHAISIKRFSVEDGCEVDPEVEAVDKDNLIAMKNEMVEMIQEYTALIADIAKLK